MTACSRRATSWPRPSKSSPRPRRLQPLCTGVDGAMQISAALDPGPDRGATGTYRPRPHQRAAPGGAAGRPARDARVPDHRPQAAAPARDDLQIFFTNPNAAPGRTLGPHSLRRSPDRQRRCPRRNQPSWEGCPHARGGRGHGVKTECRLASPALLGIGNAQFDNNAQRPQRRVETHVRAGEQVRLAPRQSPDQRSWMKGIPSSTGSTLAARWRWRSRSAALRAAVFALTVSRRLRPASCSSSPR